MKGKIASWYEKLSSCWPWHNTEIAKHVGGEGDANMWSRDVANHAFGVFSYAVAQGNDICEDFSQVETAQHSIFVGVYDGHGGRLAAQYIYENLCDHLTRLALPTRTFSEGIFRQAIGATENGYFQLVREKRDQGDPSYGDWVTAGSCCLVGVIWNKKLYVANLGDSRAVLGGVDEENNVVAEQLTRDHNANVAEIRQELWLHHHDRDILAQTDGVWRIKGVIQVSKSIGDYYLKDPEFVVPPSHSGRIKLTGRLENAVLSADPDVTSRELRATDRFVIFASDGFWEHVPNQTAVDIVHKYPRQLIARRLVTHALQEAAKKGNRRYEELKDIKNRRQIHDDISVIVVFIEYNLVEQRAMWYRESFTCFQNNVGFSKFMVLAEDGQAPPQAQAQPPPQPQAQPPQPHAAPPQVQEDGHEIQEAGP